MVLVRKETTPDDLHGLIQARGVLTAHGGMTSHAAVVARGMGKPCVAGCEALSIDFPAGTVTRLQIGPYPDRVTAAAACSSLSARGQACFPVAAR